MKILSRIGLTVGDGMVQSQSDKGCSRPPNGDDFGHHFARLYRREDGKAYQPIGSNSSKEDLVPLRRLRFLLNKCNDSLAVTFSLGEDAAVPEN